MMGGRRGFHALQLVCLAATMYALLLSYAPDFVAEHETLAILLSLSFSVMPTGIVFIYLCWRHGIAAARSAVLLKDD